MELLLGNGSDDLIQIITLAVARPGTTMMYPAPSFVMYGVNAALCGMKAVACRCARISPSMPTRSSRA